jgi:hypothetical protein
VAYPVFAGAGLFEPGTGTIVKVGT